MHALLVPFLVVLPNDFLDALSCPEDMDKSTVCIFFLMDFTPEGGVIPAIRQRYPLRSRGSEPLIFCLDSVLLHCLNQNRLFI